MSLVQFTDQMRKPKKVLKYKVQYLKPSSTNLALVSEYVRKKLWNLLTQLI